MRLSVDPDDSAGVLHTDWWYAVRDQQRFDPIAGALVRSGPWYEHYFRVRDTIGTELLHAARAALRSHYASQGMDDLATAADRFWEILLYRPCTLIAHRFAADAAILAAAQADDDALTVHGALSWRRTRPATYREMSRGTVSSRSGLAPLIAEAAGRAIIGSVARPARRAELRQLPTETRRALMRVVRSRAPRPRSDDGTTWDSQSQQRWDAFRQQRPDVVLLPAHVGVASFSAALPDMDVRELPSLRLRMDARRRATSQLPSHGNDEISRTIESLLALVPAELFDDLARVSARIAEALDEHVPRAVVAAYLPDLATQTYAAMAAQRGARLIMVQHGGAYGMLRRHDWERIEADFADVFVAWGWSEGREGLVDLPLQRGNAKWPSAPAAPAPATFAARPKVLYVLDDAGQGPEWTDGWSQMIDREGQAQEFCGGAAQHVGADVTIRERPRTKGLSRLERRWFGAVGAVPDSGESPLVETSRDMDVVVFESVLATGLLECVAQGRCCLVIHPAWRALVHDDARQRLEPVAEAGVILESAATALEVLAQLRDSVERRAAHQQAIHRFAEVFAGIGADPSRLRGVVLGDA